MKVNAAQLIKNAKEIRPKHKKFCKAWMGYICCCGYEDQQKIKDMSDRKELTNNIRQLIKDNFETIADQMKVYQVVREALLQFEDNVITPDHIKAMHKMDDQVKNTTCVNCGENPFFKVNEKLDGDCICIPLDSGKFQVLSSCPIHKPILRMSAKEI